MSMLGQFARAGLSLRPEVGAAVTALRSPAGVERVALRTRQVHRARKELRADGADAQDTHQERDVQQGLAHISSSQLLPISLQLTPLIEC